MQGDRRYLMQKHKFNMSITFLEQKICKKEPKSLEHKRKMPIFAPSEINSDAAVSNWAGDFGHPRRRFTRGVRQNVSAPFY